ncbi:MAG: integral rane sensor signal transduction histidine kinase [Candidatus Angelobacter sp.]|nr:integral rane sensor signal transduction histidine kinase [Candidatus Angelobacter sp.]
MSNQIQARAGLSIDPSQPRSEEQLKHEIFQRTLLLASAAHELKTPLAVIAGYADFLLGDYAGPLNEQQKSVVTEIQQNTLRLQHFIQSVLKFSALESGKFEILKELADINQCVAEVISQWQIPYKARGTTCVFSPDSTLGPIHIDKLKLQNIISILLENALKFTAPSGRVTVATTSDLWERRNLASDKTIHLERRNPVPVVRNNCVRIDVSDNGAGIPSEYHQAIFEEFRQIEPSGQTQGVGLGLAIARRLTELQGGKIFVQSTVGRGSTFSVLLPNQ